MKEGEGEGGRELPNGTLRKIGRGTGSRHQVQEGGGVKEKEKLKGESKKNISKRQNEKKRKERCKLFFIDWPLKMGTTGCTETSITTNYACVKSHKNELLTYTPAVSRNHANPQSSAKHNSSLVLQPSAGRC